MPSGSSTHGVNYSQCSDWIVQLWVTTIASSVWNVTVDVNFRVVISTCL